ncbi:hypothetical protein [Streptomyces clavifer]|uniref:hypothetical protein n=1 Tax=Streptomyces clavifer TaxID=68188 RepID=UPI00369892BF
MPPTWGSLPSAPSIRARCSCLFNSAADAPFRMDLAETAETFGLTATDLDSAVRNEVG